MRKRVATLPVVVASAVGLNLTLAGQNEAGVANQARQAGDRGVPSSRYRTFPGDPAAHTLNRRAPSPGNNCDSAIGRYSSERGYAMLNQDTCGRYRSEGGFDAMR